MSTQTETITLVCGLDAAVFAALPAEAQAALRASEDALQAAAAEIAIRDDRIAQLAPRAKLPTLLHARLVRKGEQAQGRDGKAAVGNAVTTDRIDLAYENAGRVSTGHLTLTLARLLVSETGAAMLAASLAQAEALADS